MLGTVYARCFVLRAKVGGLALVNAVLALIAVLQSGCVGMLANAFASVL